MSRVVARRNVARAFTPMPKFHAWNFCLCRIAGVQTRVHYLFVALAVLAAFAALRGEPGEGAWWTAFFVLLFVSVLVHELGHCLAAKRRGGWPHELMLWPLGGLVQASVPRSPGNEIAVAVWGPFVNVAIAAACFAAAPWLGVSHQQLLNDLLAPPAEPGSLTAALVLRLAFWVNLWLVLVNVIPALPMDGGRVLRGLLWSSVGYRRALRWSQAGAQVCGGLLCLTPVALRAAGHVPDAFVEIPLIGLGVFLLAGARPLTRRKDVDEDQVEEIDDREAQQASVFEVPHEGPGSPSLVNQLLDARLDDSRLAEPVPSQRERDAEEDRRVDEILLRLQKTGMDGLPPEDRELLRRASARYRQRQQ
jgi:Zn-dependent protease